MSEGKRQYRVILPVNFEDGVVHHVGETVDVDPAVATLYAHALVEVKKAEE